MRVVGGFEADEGATHNGEVDQLAGGHLRLDERASIKEGRLTRPTDHFSTTALLLPTCSRLMRRTTSTQYISTPFLVHRVKIFGAFPSKAKPKRLRLAQ